MQFKEIIGQKKAIQGLITLYNSGRMPHAIMLLGKEGVGGLPIALSFIQYLFCENKQENDSCGNCSSCIKVHKLAHPDLHLSFPTISPKPGTKASSNYFLTEFREFVQQTPYKSTFDWLQFINAENKQGNISAEECREIIDRLNMTAFEGGQKVQLIWRPEFLGKEGNILLKLIEEPPANTLILMVAESVESVLKTILSRVQLLQLAPLSTLEIAEALQNRLNIEPRRAMQIAHLAENNYAAALSLLQFAGNDLFPAMRSWFNGIFTKSSKMTNEWVEERAKEGREQQKNLLIYVQQILAHALRMTMIQQYQPALLDDELDFVKKLAQKKLDSSIYQNMTEAISKTVFHIERNSNSKIQLLFLSLQMQYLLTGKKLETV